MSAFTRSDEQRRAHAPPYDVIVIGSGAGGSAVARRLVDAGRRVLLLEKGHALPRDGRTLDIRRVVHDGEFLSRELWLDRQGRELRPEEHFNLGGKTKWYGAALLRFSEHEFGSDAEHGCRAWPIGLRALEPWYEEAERLLGVRTFAREPDLARVCARIEGQHSGWAAHPMPMALSPDIAAQPQEAAHFDGFASIAGLKGEAEQSLLAPILASPRFELRTGAEVVELLAAPDAPMRIRGVVLADGRRVEARETVIAAGALHSPRLLARFLREHGLESRLPSSTQIGANLKLHLLTAMVAISPSIKRDLIRKTTVLLNERFAHSSVQPLGFDAELIATLIPGAVPRAIARTIGRRAYGFFLQTEDGSDPRNRVRAAPGGPPVLDYDERRLASGAREHGAFTRHLQWALARAGFVSFTRRIGLQGTAHACGTLIAGDDPASSVVDAHGAVHGLRGLWVADGSVLPRSSRVNPSLTIYAWGLRLGERLANELARGDARAATRTLSTPHGAEADA